MWSLVDNLGLKEGLAEFKDQFNKDAKVTIANSEFGKSRGIDVAHLDKIEEDLRQQHKELVESASTAVVGVLSKDETLAQLLDIKADADDGDWGSDTGEVPEPLGAPPAAEAAPSARERQDSAQSADGHRPPATASAPAEAAPAAAAAAVSAVAAVAAAQKPVVAAAPQRPSVTAASGRERLRQLEAEVKDLANGKASAEAQLEKARAQSASMEARLGQLTGVSDDALRDGDEARSQAAALRRAAEAKDARIATLEAAQEKLGFEKAAIEQARDDLEKGFQERLRREVSQKEQELLEEVSYLRESVASRERRLQALSAEKTQLEKRAMAHGGGLEIDPATGRYDREAMLEAHTAIAKAFGDVSTESGLLRCFDEPLLKFTAVLFKQSLLRRMFFLVSAVMWVFGVCHAAMPDGHVIVHV